jgi:hypothetical protein
VSADVSKRFALQNYDWHSMSASDLMILFNSFKPATGMIISVKVYRSEFGKKMMAQE